MQRKVLPQSASLIAQEPHFTQLDKVFLPTLGVEAVDDLIFSIAGYPEVTLSVAEAAFPAAFISKQCDKAYYEVWKD